MAVNIDKIPGQRRYTSSEQMRDNSNWQGQIHPTFPWNIKLDFRK